jgi:hypothetical protein
VSTFTLETNNLVPFTLETYNLVPVASGCPWRDDPTNCTIPFLPGVGQSGLYQIIAAFNDAVVKSLTRYGSSIDQWPDDWKGKAGETQRFSNVTLNWDRYKKMMTDVKLQFVLDSFEGDVSQGLSLISQILEDEAFRNLDNGVRDNNTLYAVHVSCFNVIPPPPESVYTSKHKHEYTHSTHISFTYQSMRPHTSTHTHTHTHKPTHTKLSSR